MPDIQKPTGLDWVKLREDMDTLDIKTETSWQRLVRKCKDNPLVPLGVTVTVSALTYGLYNFYQNKQKEQQAMMRLRVGAQLFTILAAVGGIIYNLPSDKRNFQEFIKSGEKVIDKPK